VLDVGCAAGVWAHHVSKRVARSVGVDVDGPTVELGARLHPDAELRQADARHLPFADGEFDKVVFISTLEHIDDPERALAEVARVLKPGGRLAIADIVSERQLVDAIVCDTDLWASCIGGATQEDAYRDAIEAAGLRVEAVRPNDYAFLTDQALGASRRYGVKSVSVLARKV
jgi:ubiquinone/menaquinone biosynthesis C-methylase UbiE